MIYWKALFKNPKHLYKTKTRGWGLGICGGEEVGFKPIICFRCNILICKATYMLSKCFLPYFPPLTAGAVRLSQSLRTKHPHLCHCP